MNLASLPGRGMSLRSSALDMPRSSALDMPRSSALDMPQIYSEERLRDRFFASKDNKYSAFERVLNNEGASYFHQDEDAIITVFGLSGRRIEYLVTQIQCEGGAIYLSPSELPKGSQIAGLPNSLVASESQMKDFVPELDKPSRSRFGSSTPLDRLIQLTSKGKYFFHSAKGRNFLATRVGTDLKDEPLYRVYEFSVEIGKTLTLRRPVYQK